VRSNEPKFVARKAVYEAGVYRAEFFVSSVSSDAPFFCPSPHPGQRPGVVVGLTLGLDAAMAVAFSLAVMEIDAVNP
jgi:hypothetical protein